MKKSLKFTIETQTEENEIISICHLNERTVALELSDVARRMLKLNRSLFDKINSSTKLLGGRIYRHEIKEPIKNRNRCGVVLLDDYSYEEKEIIDLDFLNDLLQNKQTILTKNGKIISFDPNNLIDKGLTVGPLDPQNLTFDDVKMSTTICNAEEIYLFQDDGIKTFMIKDSLKDAVGLSQVAYRIEINAEESFREYVEFVLKKLDKSVNFLSSYLNSMIASLQYDTKNLNFKDEFKQSIYNQIGISTEEEVVDLGRSQIKNSEFGQAALYFYNGKLLLGQTSNSIYKTVLQSILPSPRTSPSKIKKTIDDILNLSDNISKQYGLRNKSSKQSVEKSKISSKKNTVKKFVTRTTQRFSIDNEVLGYNVFSENQTGLNKFTTSTYRTRIGAEESKYYPSMDILDDAKFMTSVERGKFANTSNASSFVTPANLVFGKKKITCSRGMNNIPINDIRQFRIAKSAKSAQVLKNNLPSGVSNKTISKNVMSDFNIVIGSAKTSLLKRSTDSNIDPLLDAKHYVGESSHFVTSNPESIFRNFEAILERGDMRILSIVSDVIPARFLRQNGSIESIEEISLDNKKSKIRPLISENLISISDIPPQVKSMMTRSFLVNKNIDPLKNRESRAIIDETQKNIFLVKALVGFEKDVDGFFDLNSPIMEDMSNVGSGKPLLAKAYNYELPEIGILKDKFMPTIYNNLLYIRD